MTATYEDALLIAVRAHHGQTRWNREPYVVHPIGVAQRVARPLTGKFTHDYIEKAKIIAVLHDVLEDTEVGYARISRQFGVEIATAITIVTHEDVDTYAEFIDRIIASGNELAIRVKLADLEDNMSTLPDGHGLWGRYQLAHAKLTGVLT